jgi:hypothetical protein
MGQRSILKRRAVFLLGQSILRRHPVRLLRSVFIHRIAVRECIGCFRRSWQARAFGERGIFCHRLIMIFRRHVSGGRLPCPHDTSSFEYAGPYRRRNSGLAFIDRSAELRIVSCRLYVLNLRSGGRYVFFAGRLRQL